MRDPTRGGLSSAPERNRRGVEYRRRVYSKIEFRFARTFAERASCSASTRYTSRTKESWSRSSHAEAAEAVLGAMRSHALGKNAAIVGEIVAEHPRIVTQRSRIGGERIVALLSGEQLPRIC